MRKALAIRLRRWADSLDPPTAEEKRHHPALKGPGELKEVEQVKPVEALATDRPSRPTRTWLPGEWGGPYV